MKKIKFIPMVLALLTLSSCGVFKAPTVSEYGGVGFANDLIVDLLKVEDETIYFVKGVSDKLKKIKDKEIGAFNNLPEYSYKLYTTNVETKGMYVLESRTVVMYEKLYWLYISKDADSIPCEYVEDFPHHDSFLNGGREKTINGKTYVSYGSSFNNTNIIGNELFVENDKSYYAVGDLPNWIAVKSDFSDEVYYIMYDINDTKELPASVVVATCELEKANG